MQAYRKSNHVKFLSVKEHIYFIKNTEINKIYMMNEICWFILSNSENKSELEIYDLLVKQLISDVDKKVLISDINKCIDFLVENNLLIKEDI